MKKTLVALATLAATGAFAQVTISGSLNYGYKVAATGTSSVGGVKGDRNNLTFSATEDVGNGLKASAMLQFRFLAENGEANYNSSRTTGNDGSMFEQSKLTLSGGFGTIDLGRFTNRLGNVGHFMEDSGYGANSSTIYGRQSGQVQYTSPSMSGLTLTQIYARKDANKYLASNAAGNGFALDSDQFNNDLSVTAVNYEMGPLSAQIAAITGMVGEKSTSYSIVYDLGNGIRANVSQYRQGADIGTGSTGMAKHTTTELGVEWKTGPWVLASTMQMNDKDLALNTTNGSTKMTKQGYKAYYSLSKTLTAEVEASNTSNAVATTNNGTAYYVGVRKTF